MGRYEFELNKMTTLLRFYAQIEKWKRMKTNNILERTQDLENKQDRDPDYLNEESEQNVVVMELEREMDNVIFSYFKHQFDRIYKDKIEKQ